MSHVSYDDGLSKCTVTVYNHLHKVPVILRHKGSFRIPVLDNTRVTRERLPSQPSQPSNKWRVKTWVRERVLVSVLDVRDRRSRVGSTRVLSRTGIRKRPSGS
jgi:hypothetical protein